ncbi:MAG: hypothetical protein MJD61_10515 [Proteobacteria bacterium]|nr:hypothetical protein [Pseudomonadota bacterium]
MDALERSDILLDQEASCADKLAQAFELMAEGFELKRAALKHRDPQATEEELEDAFCAWLYAES